jgi:hypothetical protein
MSAPGFTAEASLRPTPYKHRGTAVSSSYAPAKVVPMQDSTAAHILPWPPPWMQRVPCCVDFGGRPYCTYSYVPAWYQCEVTYTPYACWSCYPPRLHL